MGEGGWVWGEHAANDFFTFFSSSSMQRIWKAPLESSLPTLLSLQSFFNCVSRAEMWALVASCAGLAACLAPRGPSSSGGSCFTRFRRSMSAYALAIAVCVRLRRRTVRVRDGHVTADVPRDRPISAYAWLFHPLPDPRYRVTGKKGVWGEAYRTIRSCIDRQYDGTFVGMDCRSKVSVTITFNRFQ
ncbi:hypothetical protein CDAR_187841 [Caerostris darwini]|uniref:Uncharacterized protein n=1 Tax=Caerostris darwini TaxID=1538125 RepID=A0AAV4R5W9_9ARAC|nr:hypothetical protein CDAR_187841 [Caerostris darwini]